MAIERLHPDPTNPRRINPGELDALERSLREFGFVQPLVATRDGRIVGGHQRLVAARRAGYTTVPVVWVDLSPERARLLGLALNKIGGEWDEGLLARLLADLGADPALDLTLSGFGEDEVHDLLRRLDAREKRERPEVFDLDDALASATREPRTQTGDRWICGEHVVACGDATKQADAERLLDGTRPAMAFLDPPYNVDLGHHGGVGRGRSRRPIENDALDPAAWLAFVQAFVAILLGVVDGAIYCAMSSKELPLLARIFTDAGGHWSDTLIWAKDRPTLGRADYQRAYEPIWFGWREGAPHYWCGDRDQTDVWSIPRPASSPLHATMKPVALVERALANSSRPGDLVLDLFLGSGTTLIAAERTGRRCRALELDPVYVDVAVRRWERFSGGTARLERDEPAGPAGVVTSEPLP